MSRLNCLRYLALGFVAHWRRYDEMIAKTSPLHSPHYIFGRR